MGTARQVNLKVQPQTKVKHSRRRQENGLNETRLKKTGQYGSCNPVPDCVRFILGDEVTFGVNAGYEHVHDDCYDCLCRSQP